MRRGGLRRRVGDVGDFSANVAEQLASFVRRGGGLVIFPGPHAVASAYNAQLGSRGILPAELGDAAGEASQDREYKTFSTTQPVHSMAQLLADRSGLLASAHVYRHFPLRVKDQAARVV